MPLSTIRTLLLQWTKLPYAKMLAVALAAVCIHLFDSNIKKDKRIDVLQDSRVTLLRENDSVKGAMNEERRKSQKECEEWIRMYLTGRIEQLEDVKDKAIENNKRAKKQNQTINKMIKNVK